MPVCSVVIPAYNAERFVERAVRSALGQTLTDVEVIVVDDGSSDQTKKAIQQIHDARLRIIALPNNVGVSAARNAGIESSASPWVAVLDADDWFEPMRLEKLLAAAERLSADVIADDLRFVHTDGTWTGRTFFQTDGIVVPSAGQVVDALDFLRNQILGYSTGRPAIVKIVFKRHVLQDFQIKYEAGAKLSEDYLLYARLTMRGVRFALTPEPLYNYRSVENSLSAFEPVKNYSSQAYIARQLLADPTLPNDRMIERRLRHSLRQANQHLKFYEIKRLMASGKYVWALLQLLRNPGTLNIVLGRVPAAIRRRIDKAT